MVEAKLNLILKALLLELRLHYGGLQEIEELGREIKIEITEPVNEMSASELKYYRMNTGSNPVPIPKRGKPKK